MPQYLEELRLISSLPIVSGSVPEDQSYSVIDDDGIVIFSQLTHVLLLKLIEENDNFLPNIGQASRAFFPIDKHKTVITIYPSVVNGLKQLTLSSYMFRRIPEAFKDLRRCIIIYPHVDNFITYDEEKNRIAYTFGAPDKIVMRYNR